MTDDLFPGFAAHWIDTEAGRIFARAGGSGPPVVMLHGFPQTHACWHRIAPALAETHAVVCMDLRGYGWSSTPRSDADARSVFQARHGPRRGRRHGKARPRALRRRRARPRRARGLPPGARSAGPRRTASAAGHPADVSCLARIVAGAVPAPIGTFLARPYPQPEQEIGRDPLPYFDGLLAQVVGRRDARGRSTRARSPPTVPAATSRTASTPSARTTAPERPWTWPRTRRTVRRGRTIACPVLALWGEFYLTRVPGEPESTLDGLAADLRPAGGRVRRSSPAISWRRRTRPARLRRCGRFSPRHERRRARTARRRRSPRSRSRSGPAERAGSRTSRRSKSLTSSGSSPPSSPAHRWAR